MSKTMPNSTKQEKYRWIKPILDGEITIKQMNKVCPFSRRSLCYWLKAYRKEGKKGLENKSSRPKTHPNETPIRIKERVIELRKETGLGAKKLKWKLEKEGIELHFQTVHKIIKKEGLTRKYRTKKIKYNYVKSTLEPGALVEIDIKYVPDKLDNKRFYQFTAIDCATRWRYLELYEEKSNYGSMQFLKHLINKAPFVIQAVKTDNDSCFTNRYTGYLKSADPLNPRLHAFDELCKKLGIEHYLIDTGKPQQNGKVERSHRTDQEMFYDRVDFNSKEELELKMRLWNMYYNDLEHCALNGKTPNEVLGLRVQKVRA